MTASSRRRATVLTIAPDVPYLPTFVSALFAGRIVPGLSQTSGPFELARATIYVPTQRARRALATAFADASHGATLLPRIVALGALDEQEPGVEDDAAAAGAGDDPRVPLAIDDLDRRLILTELVLTWSRALRGAIVSADTETGILVDEGRPLLVGTSPADAFSLAGELGRLIDEFIIEGVNPRGLRALAEAEHDRYWQITTQFLEIAFAQWPNLLAGKGRIDAAARRVRLAEIETARLRADDASGPVIVLGSTGTNDATAKLMAAIGAHPNGAVVLPGLDQAMPDPVFASIGRVGDGAEEPAFGHPQAALKRLLAILGVSRDEVVELAPAGLSARMRLLSDALRPAEATGDWPKVRASFGAALASAFDGVALLEAADEREEALAIAVRLREAIETPGLTAALVTPDRTLARRVRNELERWSITIADSAGESLATTPAGVLARLVLGAAEEPTDAAWLALLLHPDARFGRDRETVARLGRAIEIGVFRAGVAVRAAPERRIAEARDAARSRHAHPAAKRIAPADWDAMAALLAEMQNGLAPLKRIGPGAPLSAWIATHRDALVQIAGPFEVAAGEAMFGLFDDPVLSAGSLHLAANEYRAMFERLADARVVPARRDAHPRLKILGLLEARLLSADIVILGGLDETIWPPVARSGAFLNRPMRQALGMTPPERRIGQTAHDFWMAMGADQVLLTRAKKRGGSPTTPSRFLQRLAALAGDALGPARARGEALARFARALDTPSGHVRLAAPMPRPAVALRPETLSVTRIETWIRDPYAIYAERILRLKPLDALDQPPGYAEQGTAIHRAIEWATATFGAGPLPDDAQARLVAEADRLLAAFQEDASWRAFRRPRQVAGLAFFLAYHRARLPDLVSLVAEARGELPFVLADKSTFTLTGVADRIEVDRAGAVRIVDFKTGSPPSSLEIAANLAPQLTLEAAMVAAGAFPGVPARDVSDACYIKLGTRDGGETKEVAFEDRSFAEVVSAHRALLDDLANAYRDPDQAYVSRPIAKYAMRYADYDHLARVKEWSATSGAAESET